MVVLPAPPFCWAMVTILAGIGPPGCGFDGGGRLAGSRHFASANGHGAGLAATFEPLQRTPLVNRVSSPVSQRSSMTNPGICSAARDGTVHGWLPRNTAQP